MKPVNSRVKTPIGEGVVQGMYRSPLPFGHLPQMDEHNLGEIENAVRGVLVRIHLTDAIRARLADAACITPRATGSALFVFAEEEVR